METVAFNTIGFYAALMLNRLRNEVQIRDYDSEHGEPGNDGDGGNYEQRAELANVEPENKRRVIRG